MGVSVGLGTPEAAALFESCEYVSTCLLGMLVLPRRTCRTHWELAVPLDVSTWMIQSFEVGSVASGRMVLKLCAFCHSSGLSRNGPDSVHQSISQKSAAKSGFHDRPHFIVCASSSAYFVAEPLVVFIRPLGPSYHCVGRIVPPFVWLAWLMSRRGQDIVQGPKLSQSTILHFGIRLKGWNSLKSEHLGSLEILVNPIIVV